MFKLQTKTGETVLMGNGTPFIYSSRPLAQIAKRLLEADRKEVLTIVKD